MTFWFQSNAYFAHMGRYGHLATGLFSEVDINAPSVDGRGSIVGSVVDYPDGCAYPNNGSGTLLPPRSQFETYLTGGNSVFPQSCSDFRYQDGEWYGVAIHVTDDGYMYYEARDTNDTLLYSKVEYDNRNPETIEQNTGFFLTQVSDTGGSWSIEFLGLTDGWY